MRVIGEAYLLINGGMNFLSLCLAAGLGQGRLSLPRGAAASALGAVYAALAWSAAPWARGLPVLMLMAALMAAVAFGRRFARMTPLLFAGGWLLSGCANFLTARGWGAAAVMLFSGTLTGTLLLLRRGLLLSPGGEGCTVEIRWRGRTVLLPALRDSGNLLLDGITGLPVIVAPRRALEGLIPPGLDADALPPGCRLIRVQTAAGVRMIPCFRPDRVTVRRGGKKRIVEAAAAAADFREDRALLPDALFAPKEEGLDAGL